MARTKRKAYTGSKANDSSCRSHGDCPVCKGDREHKTAKQKSEDFTAYMYDWMEKHTNE